MTELDFAVIERRRRELGIPTARLCRDAGVSERAYHYARKGERQASRKTLARLERAIRQIAMPVDKRAVVATWVQLAIEQMARRFGVDVDTVMRQTPARRATRDEEWMLASDVRAAAYWVVNGRYNCTQSEIAAAIGARRQTVQAAIQRFEDRADERARRIRDDLESRWAGVDNALQLWRGERPAFSRETFC